MLNKENYADNVERIDVIYDMFDQNKRYVGVDSGSGNIVFADYTDGLHIHRGARYYFTVDLRSYKTIRICYENNAHQSNWFPGLRNVVIDMKADVGDDRYSVVDSCKPSMSYEVDNIDYDIFVMFYISNSKPNSIAMFANYINYLGQRTNIGSNNLPFYRISRIEGTR